MMKTYNVTLPVYETINVSVEAENKREALRLAIEKAERETPLISWLVDTDLIQDDFNDYIEEVV